jgi:hypothetical protein
VLVIFAGAARHNRLVSTLGECERNPPDAA